MSGWACWKEGQASRGPRFDGTYFIAWNEHGGSSRDSAIVVGDTKLTGV